MNNQGRNKGLRSWMVVLEILSGCTVLHTHPIIYIGLESNEMF